MQPKQDTIPTFLKASWGAGALGTTSMLYLVNMFAVFFLVTHAAVPVVVATTILAGTRIYAALLNPLIGTWSDRTQGSWGRRRPWLLAGSLVCPLAVIALFNPPTSLEGTALYVFVGVALTLYCTAYSLYSIPYLALGAELSDDYRERASVMAWRTFFVYAAGVVVASGAPALVARLGSDRAAYNTMSYAAAAVILVTMLWATFFTGGARGVTHAKEKLDKSAWLRTALSNKPYLIVLVSKVTLQLGTAFTGAAMLFFMTYVLKRGEAALALYGFVSNGIGIATVPLWSRVLRKVERRPLFMALLAANVVCYLSWMAATPDEPQAIFITRALLVGAIGSGSVLVGLAMLTDTIELDRLLTGQRREGLFVGGFELLNTTSFIIGPLVTGFAFKAAGLVSGPAGKGAQPESALQMMSAAVSIIPAATCMLGILMLLFYRLDARRLAELRAQSAASTQAAAATA